MGFGLGALTAGSAQIVAVSIDGREVKRQDFGSGCAQLCQITAEQSGLRSGSHTVTLTVVSQNRASIRYRVVATAVLTESNGTPRPIELEDRTVTLTAGGSSSWSVNL